MSLEVVVRPTRPPAVRAHRECDQRSGWRVSETLLSVQDLTKRFRLRRSLGEFVTRRPGDSALAVDHVSFDLAKARFWVSPVARGAARRPWREC